MFMKKRTALLLCLALTAVFAIGCGSKTSESTTSAEESTDETTDDSSDTAVEA
jgi:outer membrane lipoprotein-sorting protein